MKHSLSILLSAMFFMTVLSSCEKKEILKHKIVYGEATINNIPLLQYVTIGEGLSNKYWYLPLTLFRSMVLRSSSTDNEDYIANHAIVLPEMTLLSELDGKLGMYEKLIQGNILATIKNILKPNNSHI